jgi:hypothetical protein
MLYRLNTNCKYQTPYQPRRFQSFQRGFVSKENETRRRYNRARHCTIVHRPAPLCFVCVIPPCCRFQYIGHWTLSMLFRVIVSQRPISLDTMDVTRDLRFVVVVCVWWWSNAATKFRMDSALDKVSSCDRHTLLAHILVAARAGRPWLHGIVPSATCCGRLFLTLLGSCTFSRILALAFFGLLLFAL